MTNRNVHKVFEILSTAGVSLLNDPPRDSGNDSEQAARQESAQTKSDKQASKSSKH